MPNVTTLLYSDWNIDFMGKRRSFKRTSLDNLQYLTIEQALGDIAYFIERVNYVNELPSNTKWITIGGFYGGLLAAWARIKYPHLIHAAVASSAPINIKPELPEFFENIQSEIELFDKDSATTIHESFSEFDTEVSNSKSRSEISDMFKLCSPLEDNYQDIVNLKRILRDMIVHSMQHRYKNITALKMIKIMWPDENSSIRLFPIFQSSLLSELRIWNEFSENNCLSSKLKFTHFVSLITEFKATVRSSLVTKSISICTATPKCSRIAAFPG